MGRNGSTENVGDKRKGRKSCQQVEAGGENVENEGEWGKKKVRIKKYAHQIRRENRKKKCHRNSKGVYRERPAGLR